MEARNTYGLILCLYPISHFSPFSAVLSLLLSSWACGPKTLLQHLRIRSSSGQIWRLTLVHVSVWHPHTPPFCLAHFRCFKGGGISPLAPLSLKKKNWLKFRPFSNQLPWVNCATTICSSFYIPVEPINSTTQMTPHSRIWRFMKENKALQVMQIRLTHHNDLFLYSLLSVALTPKTFLLQYWEQVSHSFHKLKGERGWKSECKDRADRSRCLSYKG